MLMHPSSVASIMTNPPMPAIPKARKSTRKPKTEEDALLLAAEHEEIDRAYEEAYKVAKSDNDKQLSTGAITYCKDLAKQFVYGFKPEVSTRQMQKGNICEDASIDLYNSVFFTNYKKNTERKTNEWLTGECDIDAPEKIIDIKTAWSLQTFPALKEDCLDTVYEWQGRSYMMLWDKDLFELAFCMVSTPEELVGYENPDIHYVEHIDPSLRVTTVQYERDKDKEELIKIKCNSANILIQKLIEQIALDHN